MTQKSKNLATASQRARLLLLVAALPAWSFAQAQAPAATPAPASSTAEVVKMDAFNVEGIREGMARAQSDQRDSDNLTTVLAADSVGRFPDLNLADALGRASGISIERDQGEARFINVRGASQDYSSVAIDGVTMPSPTTGSRAMRLDTIPADIVGTLEVTKAITPDIDADNIGGFVNIRTQGSFDNPGRQVRANIGYGFNEEGGGEIHNLGFTYSDRFLADRNLGMMLSFSDYATDRHTSNIETNAWQLVPGSTDSNLFRPVRPDTRTYELVRSRSSYSGRIDFRPGKNTYLYFSTVFSDWSDDEKRDNYRLPFATSGYQAGSTYPTGVVSNVPVDSNHNIRDEVNTVQSYSFGGDHTVGDLRLDFVASIGTAKQETKRPNTYFNFVIDPTRRPTISYNYGDPDLPDIQRVDANRLLIAPPEDLRFQQFRNLQGETDDNDLTLGLSATRPFTFGDRDTTLKFGVKFKGKEKERITGEERWTAARVPFTVDLRDMLGTELATNFGRYPWGYKTDRNRSATLAQRIKASVAPEIVTAGALSNYYNVTEDIWAAYGMATTDVGRLRIVGGVRVEYTENSGTANQTNNNWATFRTVTAENDYTDFFPSLHFAYRLTPNQVIRASASTAISRASFSTLRPSESVNETNLTISAGNVDINPTLSRGIDIYYEHYLQPVGMFSAGIFYKQIDDPHFSGTSIVNRNGQDYQVSRQENGSDGEIRGFELSYERTLSFLPYPLDGFGFFSNFTYAESEAELPPNPNGTSRGRVQLQGTSETTYNLAVFFEKGGFNARLSYLYRSEWLDAFDLDTPALTRFWDERPQLDFTASFPVNRWTSLYVQANNLTDEYGRRYQGNLSRVYELEGFGASYLFGAKINF
jgi:TonB-dependent receptor